MIRSIRLCSPSLLVLAFCAAAIAHAQEADPFHLRFEPYRFEPASGDAVDAELGRFVVPENRSKPDGKRLELAFVRFACTGGERCGSPIVYLAGGHDGSDEAEEATKLE